VARLQFGWFPPPASAPPHPPPSDPPLWSSDLTAEGAVDALLAAPSQRDTTVGRLRHTRGGSSAAIARWTAYVGGGGLRSYASHRNNPLAPEHRGASRMSAYVNLGMICPRRMARDAQAVGAVKYLSEFLGFRESSHLWCLLHPGGYADANVAVPDWAKAQLRATDAAAPTLAALETGQTGNAAWDDCQRCLAISGELHNNVRMAWGKAIPGWHGAALSSSAAAAAAISAKAVDISNTPPATRLQAALDLLVHLNDKFALDGGAAPSYGGLLWCLGWRDRPRGTGAPSGRPTSLIARRVPTGELEKRALKRLSDGSRFVGLVEIDGDCGDQRRSVEIAGAQTGPTAAVVSERWSVEYAKSGQSGCKGCGGKIEKHTLRIGDASGLLSGQYVQWRHLTCQKADPSLGHHTQLRGFDALADADKGLVEIWFGNGGGGMMVSPGSDTVPAPPPAKRARTMPMAAGGGAGTMWHFLNRQSAAALTPSGTSVTASITAAASASIGTAAAAIGTTATSATAARASTDSRFG